MDQQPNLNKKPKHTRANQIPIGMKLVAKVMTDSGISQRETAKELGLPLSSVQNVIRNENFDHELVEKAKSLLPSKLYQVAFMLADRLQTRPELIEKMNPYMCALVMGIMIDKARLMDGQSTENIAIKGQVAEIQTTLQRIAEMKTRLGQTLPPEPPLESSEVRE